MVDTEGVLLGAVSRTDFFDFLKKHEVHDDSVIDAREPPQPPHLLGFLHRGTGAGTDDPVWKLQVPRRR